MRPGGLSGGRQGEHAVELRFEPGSDPDTAARKAFADWDAALARLPSDGQYAAEIAMVEAEGGYYIAVDVKIVKAGKPDTDDDDEEVGDNYIVNTPEGLMDLFEAENGSDFENKIITLQAGRTYTVNKTLASTFKGTLTSSENGEKATIKITGENLSQGLFETIESGGKVENLQINVTGSISGSASSSSHGYAGAVAGINRGAISNCDVTIEAGVKISASESTGTSSYVFAGAVAGENRGTISNCDVTIEAGVKISASESTGTSSYVFAGAVAGENYNSISGCTVTISDEISASATITYAYAGGVAGYNKSGTVSGSCNLNGGKIEATVGENTATVTEDDKDGTDTDGSAYAGTKIGYDSEARRPAA